VVMAICGVPVLRGEIRVFCCVRHPNLRQLAVSIPR
jgi:hypothetical protein